MKDNRLPNVMAAASTVTSPRFSAPRGAAFARSFSNTPTGMGAGLGVKAPVHAPSVK